jgi:hypothetical protein
MVLWAWLGLRDAASWPRSGLVALGLCALAVLAVRPLPILATRLVLAVPWWLFVAVGAAAAAATSWWTVRAVLHETPTSRDGAVYLAQARAMSHWHFGIPSGHPIQDFSLHFFAEGPDGLLYTVFPPGWPLALTPFVWAGRPMLVGPVVAALAALAQAALGRSVGRLAGDGVEGELWARASLLLTLPSIGRAFQTADLLSHAMVALLGAVAMTVVLDARREELLGAGRALAIGACLGWIIASRLLDGVLLTGAVVAAAGRTGARARPLGWALVGAAPFLALLAVEQRYATGAWFLPTQSTYFARSDWPPGCHRLGIGVDVGCTVEHRQVTSHYGPAGYDLHQAIRVVAERATGLGKDLFSFAPLALLAFLPAALGASAVDALLVALVVGFTLAYGSFYYGNWKFLGSRHLFPIAPYFWLLAARAPRSLPHRATPGWLDLAHVRAAGVVAVVVASFVCARATWAPALREAHEWQDPRSDLRRTLAIERIDRALVKSQDEMAVASAWDPWRDGDERLFVVDDGAGLLELRRAHPDLPIILSLPSDQVGRLYPRTVPPGVSVELERSWPTFIVPRGLGGSRERHAGASGGWVLQLAHAGPGASIAIPFETAQTGDYRVRVDGFAGPRGGDYELLLDGEALSTFRGYAPEDVARQGDAIDRALTRGRHVLVATCTGHDDRSTGYEAQLDALVGEPTNAGPP